MNMVNQSKVRVIGQPIPPSSVLSTLSCTEPLRAFFTGILVAAGTPSRRRIASERLAREIRVTGRRGHDLAESRSTR
jgi:hypothetical protein